MDPAIAVPTGGRVVRGVRPAVLVMLSFAVEAASAGPLVAASYSQIVAGARFDAAALAPSGTLVGNTFTLDPGSAFATTGCVAGIGNPFGCTETASGSFPRHVLRFDYQIGGNGALTATQAMMLHLAVVGAVAAADEVTADTPAALAWKSARLAKVQVVRAWR